MAEVANGKRLMGKKLISDLPDIDLIETTDLFVVARPNNTDYKSGIQKIVKGMQGYIPIDIGVGPAGQLNNNITGSNIPNGNFRVSEIQIISKGEIVIGGMPDWSGGTNQNLLGFGHGCLLANGSIFTIYNREIAESFRDSDGLLVGKISKDRGASWGPEFLLQSASQYGANTAMMGCGACWQNKTGRIFVTFFASGDSPAEYLQYMMYTDDPTASGGWSTAYRVYDPAYNDYWYTNGNALDLPDGSMLLAGYGKFLTDTSRSATVMRSIDNGITWMPLAIVKSGVASGKSYIEPCLTFRPDGSGSILCSIRSNEDQQTVFSVSTDNGNTWSALGSQTLSSVAKPHITTMSNGTMVVLSRDSSSNGTFESCLFICRDGSGMNANSWSAAFDFDYRHYYHYYGAIFEISPNTLGCTFGGRNMAFTNCLDWCFVTFSDGYSDSPLGDSFKRNLTCNKFSAYRQIPQSVPRPVAYPSGGSTVDTQCRAQLSALMDALSGINGGSGVVFNHPSNMSLLGWYEPWQVPLTINDWFDNFAHSDSTTVVANATRTSGQTLTPLQLAGTFGTSSGKLYLSSTSGGTSSFGPLIAFDFGKGDGSMSWTLDSYTTSTTVTVACRVIDGNNDIIGQFNGSTLTLYKLVGGTPTSLSGPVACALSVGNQFIPKIVTSGNNIQIFANVNGAGFSTTPLLSYTLTGGDATTFANTITKWGLNIAAVNANRYSNVTFNGTLISGDFIGELPELGGVSGNAGSLLQQTAANQFQYLSIPSVCDGKAFLYNNGTTKFMDTAAISKSGAFTLFWAGLLQYDVTTNRNLAILVSSGQGGILGVTNTKNFYGGTTSLSLAPFATYPVGLTLLRLEIIGTSTKLYVNGVLISSSTGSALGTITSIRLGDSGSTVQCIFHLSAFNAILTSSQAREHERLIAATLPIVNWNPR